MTLEERIIDLEIRMTHQDQTIEDLNKTIFEQWQTIDQMNKEMAALKLRLKTMVQNDIDDAPYTPPHY